MMMTTTCQCETRSGDTDDTIKDGGTPYGDVQPQTNTGGCWVGEIIVYDRDVVMAHVTGYVQWYNIQYVLDVVRQPCKTTMAITGILIECFFGIMIQHCTQERCYIGGVVVVVMISAMCRSMIITQMTLDATIHNA